MPCRTSLRNHLSRYRSGTRRHARAVARWLHRQRVLGGGAGTSRHCYLARSHPGWDPLGIDPWHRCTGGLSVSPKQRRAVRSHSERSGSDLSRVIGPTDQSRASESPIAITHLEEGNRTGFWLTGGAGKAGRTRSLKRSSRNERSAVCQSGLVQTVNRLSISALPSRRGLFPHRVGSFDAVPFLPSRCRKQREVLPSGTGSHDPVPPNRQIAEALLALVVRLLKRRMTR